MHLLHQRIRRNRNAPAESVTYYIGYGRGVHAASASLRPEVDEKAGLYGAACYNPAVRGRAVRSQSDSLSVGPHRAPLMPRSQTEVR